ncbi:PaaI family thioesterase [Mangrovimicrobium sediminis]|uniref:PaaI family thioesterase n=1 Tax=Mangrovimicrobium sediminis TaxID=2562682 RepID=A0A4Z0LW56_9GAMM|nr:PaaI family thioesterase [Haliea sp. SAOS-164]TGD71407.1 PaaI family thioesterase [Haliea sp. SAOS-164]
MTAQDQDREQVPTDFEPMPGGLGFIDGLAPLYRRLADGIVGFGLLVEAQHCNSLGICHGGVIMTLADIAAASGATLRAGRRTGAPTVNLSVDFIGAGKLGQWLHTEIEGVSTKRHFGFAHGRVCHGERVVARFNGTFYFAEHTGVGPRGDAVPGMWRGLNLD